MNIIYDLSELIADLFYFSTIDGPDVSYKAVGDHPTDVILLVSITTSGVIGTTLKSCSRMVTHQGMPAPLVFLTKQMNNTKIQHIPVHNQGLLLLRCYKCLWEPAFLVPL